MTAFVSYARADTFKIKPDELSPLIDELASLDGYEQVIDQGPGNPARVVHTPYKFARETRAKLGADRAALIKAIKVAQEKISAIRLKISGDPDKIDENDKEQMKLWNERIKPISATPLEIELSPITADELTANDNPIKITTLSILNRLRPASTK